MLMYVVHGVKLSMVYFYFINDSNRSMVYLLDKIEVRND
jgi:hypothetical protein